MSNRSRITVTEQAQGERRKVIGRVLAELGLPALASALGVGFATRNWPASFAAGLAISSAILVVDIHIDGKQAVIAISDQGSGIPARYKVGEGPDHGLYNVDQRLRKTYGEAYGLQISANQPQGTIVTLRIPVRAGR
jgi:sensor histidine kinase regulating citrate/malate metabolism